jgi:hypothetical protein
VEEAVALPGVWITREEGAMVKECFDAPEVAFSPRKEERGEAAGVRSFEVDRGR